DATGQYAYLCCYSPHSVSLRTSVAVAGQRWCIEESFQAGLDLHQVRRWKSWHRWTTPGMLARAFLAVATERDIQPTPTGLITLTVNEFRRLVDALLLTTSQTTAPITPIPNPTISLPQTRTPMIPIYGCSNSRGNYQLIAVWIRAVSSFVAPSR